MARQPIIIGIANAKTGDTLFDICTKVNANETELYADVALLTGLTKTYWFDAADTLTSTTPISHTGGATGTYLTNNAIGASTTSYNPDSNDALWNPSTNKFDFSSLKIGDTVEGRIDLTITNAAAQEINIMFSLAETTAPFELIIDHTYYKTAATGTPVTALFKMYVGSNDVKNGGARFRFVSADAATIQVNGWFYEITEV